MFFLKENTATVIYFLLLINHFIFQKITAQIVGGQSTPIERLPFVASLRENHEHYCGGAIISVRHILTAAHCLHNHRINAITVVTGSFRSFGAYGTVHGISHVTLHPGYAGRPFNNLRNDIAVIKLNSNIQFSETTHPIGLPSRDAEVGERLSISGWGYLSESDHRISPILQRAYATVIENHICARDLKGVDLISPGQLCTFEGRGIGTCYKDSGGPLTARGQIFGVISFGVPCARGVPDVFTRVYAYRSWIRRTMAS